MLAKDSITTAVSGLIFLGTCVVGRPLCYYAGKRMMARAPADARRWESFWTSEPGFRHVFYVMSVVWGCGLLAEAAIRLPLVYLLPIDVMAGLSSVMSIAVIIVLATWTSWYSRYTKQDEPTT